MLRKFYFAGAGFLVLSLVLFSCTKSNAESKKMESHKEELISENSLQKEDTDFYKIDLVLSKMSERFCEEVKIPDEKKYEFLADLSVMMEEQENIKNQYKSDDLPLLFLIDKTHSISSEYEPKELVHLENNEFYKVNKNSLSLRPEASDALLKMAKAASLDGINLTISSTYRSYEYQKNLFAYWVKVDGLEEAERESARPGTSQHQLGIAMDFAPVDDAFAQTESGKWVYQNAAKFGWSLSFPKNYEDITGYRWESWHFRYIGEFTCEFQKKWFLDVQQYMIEFLDEWNKTEISS